MQKSNYLVISWTINLHLMYSHIPKHKVPRHLSFLSVHLGDLSSFRNKFSQAGLQAKSLPAFIFKFFPYQDWRKIEERLKKCTLGTHCNAHFWPSNIFGFNMIESCRDLCACPSAPSVHRKSLEIGINFNAFFPRLPCIFLQQNRHRTTSENRVFLQTFHTHSLSFPSISKLLDLSESHVLFDDRTKQLAGLLEHAFFYMWCVVTRLALSSEWACFWLTCCCVAVGKGALVW